MTRVEFQKTIKDKAPPDWKPYYRARRHFPLCKIKGVVLHHKIIGCTNYELWVVDELVPMFKWCHLKFHHHSPETRQKISKSLTGRTHTEDYKNGMLGKHQSEEVKKKLSEALKGRVFSEKTLRCPKQAELDIIQRIQKRKSRRYKKVNQDIHKQRKREKRFPLQKKAFLKNHFQKSRKKRFQRRLKGMKDGGEVNHLLRRQKENVQSL